NGQIVTTLAGTDVTVTIDTSGVYIDGAQVTVADLVADNGVVHVIDAVLLPNPGCTDPTATNYDANAIVDDGSCTYATNTVYDVVVTSPDHNLLEVAIDTCSLDGTLSGAGPFTLFAPTDAAFNALPQGTVAALLNDLPLLTNILLHHVVGDSVMSGMLSNGQIVTTLLGTDVTVTINTSGVFIDNAQVTVADIIADNGVVHVIDAVLLPNPGCTDPTATNYDANAIVDDGSCTYATNTVYDVVVTSPDHTYLEIGIDTCGFDAYLSGPGPFTLFAPTDAAFNALPPVTLLALLNDIPQLTNILKHHVVGDSVMSGMLSNGQVITTLLGTDVTVTINSSGVYIDNAMVTVVDIVADNGVVHVIDAVLLPPAPSNTIYDIISKSSDHTVLTLAIDTCGLAGTLKGAGPFTVFAPTDAAFNALPSGTIAALLNDLPQLTDILLHHVVGDSVMSGMLSNSQVVTTLLGDDVTVTINSNGVYIDNALVTVADIVADNGVVHVIDAVLLPSTTGINDIDNVSNYEYMYSVNLLGKKVNRNKRNQVVLDIYSNGKVVKRFNP
ncbi:MAG: fasciclin domain-containing protein, partial [Flavobacteriaceae bacterium]|nr:fasciclin domain-containing protein [Flavobacteriaceae bacterium]